MIDNVYDALDRMTEMHRPTGVTTYNTWNKQDQITRMRTVCDECKWVISDYTYTYDAKGFVTSEKAIESIYLYPTVSNTYTQYKDMVPQTAAHKSLHHSTGTKPDYRMATTFRTFCYDNDGRLISSTENEENEGRTIYTYSYDDNGNRTGYQKCVNGYITERIAFWYDVDNELRRATHTYGTREYNVNYTYDNDGNLITEKGSTGSYNVNKTYQYTVENRLQAVYEGNDLLLALAYDGDGNKVFQMSYDPFTNATGKTGINSPNPKERSQTELDLRSMIKTSGKINSYSLVEYITDVNTGYLNGIEYPEVLMELNMNGETDTVYVYGNERIQKDKYTGLKNYYIYNGRGSVTGNLSSQGRLTASYRYTPYGELSYGQNHSYANAYTFNGENYHPMTNTQYLRTRVYQTKTGRFLTQDTYLGDITNPITTNRYIYCIDNPLNYTDPSGLWVTKEEEAVLKSDPVALRLLSDLRDLGDANASVHYARKNSTDKCFVNRITQNVIRLRKSAICERDESSIEIIRSSSLNALDYYLAGKVREQYAYSSLMNLALLGAPYNGRNIRKLRRYTSNMNYNYQQYDNLILGWTAYVNLKNTSFQLNPELVKAIMYEESHMGIDTQNTKSPNANIERDVMQVLDPRNTTIYEYLPDVNYDSWYIKYIEHDTNNNKVVDYSGEGYKYKLVYMSVKDYEKYAKIDGEKNVPNHNSSGNQKNKFNILNPIFKVDDEGRHLYDYSYTTPFMSTGIGVSVLQEKYILLGRSASEEEIASAYNIGVGDRYHRRIRFLLDNDLSQDGSWEKEHDSIR